MIRLTSPKRLPGGAVCPRIDRFDKNIPRNFSSACYLEKAYFYNCFFFFCFNTYKLQYMVLLFDTYLWIAGKV